MTLRQQANDIGQFLFRYRSFLPPAMLLGLTCLLWNTVPRDTSRSVYAWRSAAGALTLLGVLLRWATVGRVPRGTSGRNTKRQKATYLNRTGIYSVVRNPLYIANAMIWVGITLLFESPALTAGFALALLLYYGFVVFAEEEYLAETFGPTYARYASRTPALIARPELWIPPDRPFSWRMVLRREHDSVFSTVTGMVLVYYCMDLKSHFGHLMLRREWVIPWAVLACAWLALKVAKKHTRLLHVPRSEPSPIRVSSRPNRVIEAQ